MFNRVKTSVVFFVILGAMNGIMISLTGSFFLDYIVRNYTTEITLSYADWLVVCAPCFACVGALFNLAVAIFMHEEELPEEKEKRKSKRKKTVRKNSNKKS